MVLVVLSIGPLRPSAPYISALPFHCSGKLTSTLIGGAVGSTGAISTIMRQNAPTALAPVPEAGFAVADVTFAPLVASGVTLAGMESPANSSQAIDVVLAARTGAGLCVRAGERSPPIHAARTAVQATSP